jgi:hypothetical protein
VDSESVGDRFQRIFKKIEDTMSFADLIGDVLGDVCF